MTYLAFVIDDDSRNKLLKLVPPKFQNVIAHHVTLLFPKNEAERNKMNQLYYIHKDVKSVTVIGYRCGDHIEAVEVLFEGTSARPDGSFYHITVSLEPPAKPVDSNKLKASQKLTEFSLTGHVHLVN